MKKQLLNLGKGLSKVEQKQVHGGGPPVCGGTGGMKVNLSQAQCYGYGYSWEWGACYVCY